MRQIEAPAKQNSPEHVTLVTGTNLLWSLTLGVHGIGDLSALGVQPVDHFASLVVEALLWGVETDVLDGVAHHLCSRMKRGTRVSTDITCS